MLGLHWIICPKMVISNNSAWMLSQLKYCAASHISLQYHGEG